METILITGANGFVGKNLKKYFEKSYKILSPRSFELDCRNQDAVKEYFSKNNISYIIHCASVGGARGVEDKDTTVVDNLKMVNNLLEFKNANCKMIVFGSGAMYGKQRPIIKISEDEIGNVTPSDLYGQSKVEIAKIASKRSDMVCLNIFACYGYNEFSTRFPSYAIGQNLKHLPIVINQNVVFDYLFIEDLEKIVEHFILNNPKKYNIINVTPSKSSKLTEIAEIVNSISDYKSEITLKSPILGNEYTGDNSRLMFEIPEMEFTSLKNGLKKLYEYIKNTL